ncbi:type II toxin-antitoxin system VapC family toxin [Ramlibacter sp. AN1015]|uniref:type II toxin-antitoxin system VapC family toxin n=1 Tax=Ramlibacter sp. AN1015 TaxID=3133428 RepID=UPI0030C6015D
MRVLFDSSALFVRYAGETGASQVDALHVRASAVVLAAHCQAELMAALTRQWREGAFGDDEFRRVRTRMREDFEAYHVEPLSRTVEDFALAAMVLAPLGAADALHIGSAQAARVQLFVTADPRQSVAAQAVGLRTECIA